EGGGLFFCLMAAPRFASSSRERDYPVGGLTLLLGQPLSDGPDPPVPLGDAQVAVDPDRCHLPIGLAAVDRPLHALLVQRLRLVGGGESTEQKPTSEAQRLQNPLGLHLSLGLREEPAAR